MMGENLIFTFTVTKEKEVLRKIVPCDELTDSPQCFLLISIKLVKIEFLRKTVSFDKLTDSFIHSLVPSYLLNVFIDLH